jgi:STE24 endopeptidase
MAFQLLMLLLAGASLVGAVTGLPFSWYRTFRLEARFGFNRTTLRLWLADLAKGLALGVAIGLPLLLVILLLMGDTGWLWWLWAWLVWMAFQLLMLLLYPTVIAPLFNRFTPLPAGAARERIEHLLARCGFAAAGLFVMDGSRRSGHGNAYFTGFGRARRIVFFDTLLNRLVPDEVEAVLAHELGHYKLHHVQKRIAWTAALSLGLLALLAWVATTGWFYQGLGIPADLIAVAQSRPGVALALFLLVLPVFTFVASPLAAHYSRRHEFEADAFAARNASAPALVSGLVKLYEDNAATLTPDPLHSAFYDSHPPAAIRVAHLQSAPTG